MRKHLSVTYIGRCCSSADKVMVDISVDVVLVSVMVNSVLFEPASV